VFGFIARGWASDDAGASDRLAASSQPAHRRQIAVPKGIDPGFGYNVCEAFLAQLAD
jgi:hypothetical protein